MLNRLERGIALIQVILIGSALFGLGVAALTFTRSDQMISNNILNGTKAFWIAAGGAEIGEAWLRSNYATAVFPSTLGPTPFADGAYTVVIDRYAPGGGTRFRITSTGTAPDNARKVVEEIVVLPGFDADLGLIQIDGSGTPTDMEDPGGGPGLRIPDWTIDSRGHDAVTGLLDPACPAVPAVAGADGNDNTDMPEELDKLRCKIVQRANECCNADGSTNTSACIESPGTCSPGTTCNAASCAEGTCSIGACVPGSCTDASCTAGTCSIGVCGPGSCADSSCAPGTCSIGACMPGTCSDAGCVEGRCVGGFCDPGACNGEEGCDAGTCPIGACQAGSCADSSCTIGTCVVEGCAPGACNDPSTCAPGTCAIGGCTVGSCDGSGCVVGTCALDCQRLCPDGICEDDPGLNWVRSQGYYTPNQTDLTPLSPDPPPPDCDVSDATCCKRLDLSSSAMRATGNPPEANLPVAPSDRGPLALDTPDDPNDDHPVNVLTDAETDALSRVIEEILDAALAASDEDRLCITSGYRGGTQVLGTLDDPKIVVVSDPRDQNPKMQALSIAPPCPGRGRVNNLVIEDGAVVEGAGILILPRELEVKDATFDWRGLILVLENGKMKIGPASCGAVYGGVLLQTAPHSRNNARLDFDKNLESPSCSAPNNAFSLNFSCGALSGAIGKLVRSVSWIEVF